MDGEALVQLALSALSCTQKQLAAKLGQNAHQISKWKQGEHMSSETEEKLRTIAGIGDKDPRFVLWAGSIEQASKWERLMRLIFAGSQRRAPIPDTTLIHAGRIWDFCAGKP